jgi:hypothetical protein
MLLIGTIKGTYTITQADIDAGEHRFSYSERSERKCNRYLWNYRDNDTGYPIDTNSRIALVKTAAVGGTGKVGDVITYTLQ